MVAPVAQISLQIISSFVFFPHNGLSREEGDPATWGASADGTRALRSDRPGTNW